MSKKNVIKASKFFLQFFGKMRSKFIRNNVKTHYNRIHRRSHAKDRDMGGQPGNKQNFDKQIIGF